MIDDEDILQEMRDVGGGTHTACKLGVAVSKGKQTRGKRYVNRRKCVWCSSKSSVYCAECGKVFCYPVVNREEVVNSCFYHHVHRIKAKGLLLSLRAKR